MWSELSLEKPATHGPCSDQPIFYGRSARGLWDKGGGGAEGSIREGLKEDLSIATTFDPPWKAHERDSPYKEKMRTRLLPIKGLIMWALVRKEPPATQKKVIFLNFAC